MDVGQIQSGLVGMALFDAWSDSVAAMHGKKVQQGDPLIAAAFAAFEGYINQVEGADAAMIAGVSSQLGVGMETAVGQMNTYSLNAANNGVISQAQMAPLLALNLIA